MKCLQSDNEISDNVNRKVDTILTEMGITKLLSAPSVRNRMDYVAERINRTLLDTARCLKIQWTEAVQTTSGIDVLPET